MTDVISTAESRVSEANYPTFETRLVPISELKTHIGMVAVLYGGWCNSEKILKPVSCINYDRWFLEYTENYDQEVEAPTHFLQWRLKGTETWSHKFPAHEFKMGEE